MSKMAKNIANVRCSLYSTCTISNINLRLGTGTVVSRRRRLLRSQADTSC